MESMKRDKLLVLTRLAETGQELASATDLDVLLARLNEVAKDLTDSERSSILLLDEDSNELYFREAMGVVGEVREKVRIPVDERSVAGWCTVHRKPVLVADASKEPRHYKGVDEVTSFVTRSLVAVPIVFQDRCFGVLEVINHLGDPYEAQDVEHLQVLASQAAVALNNVFMVDQLQNFFVHTVELLIAATESLDASRRGHVVRVARLATMLAREVGLAGKDLERVLYGAYFHDIGRLLKGQAATGTRERDEPVVGGQLLEKIKLLSKVAPLVRAHRERFDGSGYPDGLKGEDIPLGARILGLVVDYEEAGRSNGGRLSPRTFHERFFVEAEQVHDPALVAILRRHVDPPR